MKKIKFNYKDCTVRVHLSEENTIIFDSYRIKKRIDMYRILQDIKLNTLPKYAIHKREILDMINEWRTHNLLYSLGLFKDRTKDTDLNIKQSKFIKFVYSLLSLFYPYK